MLLLLRQQRKSVILNTCAVSTFFAEVLLDFRGFLFLASGLGKPGLLFALIWCCCKCSEFPSAMLELV